MFCNESEYPMSQVNACLYFTQGIMMNILLATNVMTVLIPKIVYFKVYNIPLVPMGVLGPGPGSAHAKWTRILQNIEKLGYKFLAPVVCCPFKQIILEDFYYIGRNHAEMFWHKFSFRMGKIWEKVLWKS